MTIRVLGPGGERKGENKNFTVNIQEGFFEESTFELRLEGALRSEGRQTGKETVTGLPCTAVQVRTAQTAAGFYVYTSSVQ